MDRAIDIDIESLPRTLELIEATPSENGSHASMPTLVLLDQRLLPDEVCYMHLDDWRDVIDAISNLAVRGAPAIGIAGAAALCLRSASLASTQHALPSSDDGQAGLAGYRRGHSADDGDYLSMMEASAEEIDSSRPTAISLHRSLEACMDLVRGEVGNGSTPQAITKMLFEMVNDMIESDIASNRKMGEVGASLLTRPSNIITHCNAGSLATAFFGTALGVIYTAAERGLVKMVYADETRPMGQGSRLTVWELAKAGVPVTLICDDMAASVMANKDVDAVFVGADRIASNGDVANKIGTLGVAILARHFGIPFYVVAPTETIDFDLGSGDMIPIEQRDPSEVVEHPIESAMALNPAFDVTPASLITKIVTEKGAFSPDSLRELEG